MNVESKHFSAEQFQQFLDAELSAGQQSVLERHLELCGECRQQLQTSAADLNWWEDASDFLTDDEFESVHTLRDIKSPLPGQAAGQSAEGNADSDSELPAGIRQVIAWLDPTDDPAMLGRLGGYEIAGVVGAGGMGVVLKGFDRSLNRYVAVKILAPHLATSGAARKRFSREAQAAAAVVHDNVIPIHGVDATNSLPFLVMPYLRGISLQRRIEQHGALSVPEILRLGMQTARGLSAAHDQGLVHRDVKPANILLDGTTERVLLTDFGLARAADDASLTQSGVIAGTPFFMSPEQAEGAAIDHRSDLFSLGSVLYAMCTGRPPFRAETSWGILRKVTDSQPHSILDLNPDVPEWLCQLIARLHQKDPALRFQTAEEVGEILERGLAHVQQPAEFSVPSTTELGKPITRYSFVRSVAVVSILAAVVWSGSQWSQWWTTNDEADASLVESAAMSGSNDGTADSNLSALEADRLPEWNEEGEELSSIRDAVEALDEAISPLDPPP